MDCLHRVERILNGSGGRTRTATGFTPTDFESVVSEFPAARFVLSLTSMMLFFNVFSRL